MARCSCQQQSSAAETTGLPCTHSANHSSIKACLAHRLATAHDHLQQIGHNKLACERAGPAWAGQCCMHTPMRHMRLPGALTIAGAVLHFMHVDLAGLLCPEVVATSWPRVTAALAHDPGAFLGSSLHTPLSQSLLSQPPGLHRAST